MQFRQELDRKRRPNYWHLLLLPVLVDLIAVILSVHTVVMVQSIVVDGNKKKDLQATKKQSDARSMLDDELNLKTCGISDKNYDEHEFVSMAREGQFPWMVSFQITTLNNSSKEARDKLASTGASHLQDREKSGGGHHTKKVIDLHFCCGSFISEKWILSAAHCFASSTMEKYLQAGKLKAVAGSHKVSSRNPINLNLTIERIYLHANFDKSLPVGFDIALVELKENSPVTFSQKRVNGGPMDEQIEPFINGICLPLKDKKYKTNETTRIAGWGMSSHKDETSMPSKLLTTDILIKDKQECIKQYSDSLKSDWLKRQSEKFDDFICASYKDSRDACQSDSGAPLMEYASGKAVVIGVVSYGIGCATKEVPGLYTRTSAYINWIKDIMKHGTKASVSFRLVEASQSQTLVDSQTGVTTTVTTTTSTTTRQPKQFKFFDQN